MYGLNDLFLESLRAAVLAALLIFLVVRCRDSRFGALPGARLIVVGFGLMLFATLLDITDEIPGLERFVVIGATEVEAYIETFFGYLAAFVVLFAGFVRIIPSIARLEKVDQELRESEEKFRSVFETIPEVIGITRLQDDLVLDLNPAFEELTGIPREKLLGRRSLDINVWHDPAERDRMVQDVLKHGMVRNLEARFNTRDGRVRDALVSARLLMLNGEQCLLSVYKDVTEPREASRAIEESEEKFRSVFETIPDVLSITRLRDGLVVDLNPAILDVTGVPREHFIGRSSIDMKAWANPADRDRMVQGVLAHGAVRNMEAQLNTGSGTLRDCLVSARLMQLNGEPHILTVFKDITDRKRAQEALQEREESYRTLFYSSPDPVWIIDNQRFVECNQAAIDMLGYPDKDSLRNSHPSELSPEFQPDGEPSFSKAERMMLIAREKGINRFEWVHRRWDKSDFFAEVTLSALTLHGREVLYCIWRDITDRKQVMRSLQESESRYRRLHESMSDAFAQVDMAGNIVEVNRAFESMTGYSQEELKHLSYRHLTPECWHATEARILEEQVLALGYSEIYEKEYRCKDGTIVPVELRAYLLKDEEGAPFGMWAIVRDISERKQVMRALQASETKFRLIFETSPDPLIIARLDGGGIIDVNRAFVAQTGIPADEARGRTSLDLDLWNNPAQRTEFLGQIVAEGFVHNLEAEFRMKDGELRSGLTSAKVVELDGERCILIDIRDITRQKEAERILLEMDRMKSEFISTAAHELRTPLATMLGYTELLRAPGDFGGFSDEQKEEFLEEVYNKGETLSRIIDEMLDITRIESGRPIALDLQPHEPRVWLAKIIRRFELQGDRHAFVLDFDGPQPEVLTCDLHRMTQVLENLLSNAVKYSPRGGTIRLSGRVAGDDYIISVADEGIGMNSEEVSRVFDKFYRADSSNTAIGGLGLGMSIARQIVEIHGGRIWVESEASKGTTVSFSLPLTLT